MITRKIAIIVLGVFVLLITGCADRQEEADRLQEEVESMESDTVADTAAESVRQAQPTDSPSTAGSAIPPADEPVRTMPQRPESAGYTVQVASCEDQNYAMYLVDLYTERGYEPWVTSYVQDGQQYYRVRLGIFTSRSEADALREELKDKYSLDTWIDTN
ncbi:MAG: SPOR domain-containing protein [Candidatus Zixiibacteriota bacterium]|nr:MAG: SPOR domain-containing protein [candidate division Zixibacteria bacterium]